MAATDSRLTRTDHGGAGSSRGVTDSARGHDVNAFARVVRGVVVGSGIAKARHGAEPERGHDALTFGERGRADPAPATLRTSAHLYDLPHWAYGVPSDTRDVSRQRRTIDLPAATHHRTSDKAEVVSTSTGFRRRVAFVVAGRGR